MPRPTLIVFLSALLFLIASTGTSSEWQFGGGWEACACKNHLIRSIPLDPDADHAGNGRKYARDREIDLKHVLLDLHPDFEKRSLAGTATLTFAPIAKPLTQLRLDAIDLRVASVEASVPVKAWDAGKTAIIITFAEAIPADRETRVKIVYSAEPRDGWFYRTEAMGYPKGDDHFWTQGEPEYHRHWFPGYDYPNERFTSEVICRVPKGMTVISNGRLIKQGDEGDHTLFHWSQEQEHVNYLISVVGGYFNKLESKHGELPLAFLTPPSEFAVAEHSFRDTAAILDFFEKETGVKFPWAKYYSVCVTDFTAGGMENTSVTTLTTSTLFSPETETLRTTHRLDAHEAAHQWFGDLLTCKDWSHLWLNEGFATYYTHLYDGQKSGPTEMSYQLYLDAQGVISNQDEKPIVWRGYKDPMEQFDYRAYPKGGWVLHMLRGQLGPDLFRRCINTYIERHRNGNVVTQDLMAVVEELSGQSWDEFFDQWVFHGGEPMLKAAYAWDETRGQAKLTIQQTQKTGEQVLLFDFPLPLRFIDEKGGIHDFTIRIHETNEDFYFDLPARAKIVRLDPDTTVLAGVDFTPPNPMLHAQLVNADDLIGRVIAAKTLGGRNDAESINLLKKALSTDPHYGVRIEAAKSLAKTHTPEALAVLLGAVSQEDARARQEVVASIGKFYTGSAFAALRDIAAKEKNPDIVSNALGAVGKFLQEDAQPVLLAALNRESYRHRIAAAAIQGLRVQGDDTVIVPLREHLQKNETRFTSRDFGQGLDSLAYLARHEEDETREVTRQFISGYLEHPKETLRRSAITALGTLEDPRSLGALQTFVESGNADLPESRVAEEAIRKLSSKKGQADEVTDLRRELLELQKELKTVKDGLETVKKQVKPEPPEKKAAK